MSDSRSYGPAFNSNGGGWYVRDTMDQRSLIGIFLLCRFAVERTSTFIKAWFWPRNAGNVPVDVKNGQTVVNTGSWVCTQSTLRFLWFESIFLQGTPSAYFPNTQCDIASHFKAHNIIINLTFCEYTPTLNNCRRSLVCLQAETGRVRLIRHQVVPRVVLVSCPPHRDLHAEIIRHFADQTHCRLRQQEPRKFQ